MLSMHHDLVYSLSHKVNDLWQSTCLKLFSLCRQNTFKIRVPHEEDHHNLTPFHSSQTKTAHVWHFIAYVIFTGNDTYRVSKPTLTLLFL